MAVIPNVATNNKDTITYVYENRVDPASFCSFSIGYFELGSFLIDGDDSALFVATSNLKDFICAHLAGEPVHV